MHVGKVFNQKLSDHSPCGEESDSSTNTPTDIADIEEKEFGGPMPSKGHFNFPSKWPTSLRSYVSSLPFSLSFNSTQLIRTPRFCGTALLAFSVKRSILTQLYHPSSPLPPHLAISSSTDPMIDYLNIGISSLLVFGTKRPPVTASLSLSLSSTSTSFFLEQNLARYISSHHSAGSMWDARMYVHLSCCGRISGKIRCSWSQVYTVWQFCVVHSSLSLQDLDTDPFWLLAKMCTILDSLAVRTFLWDRNHGFTFLSPHNIIIILIYLCT